MILLDTNVISEAMKPEPDTNVLQWLNAQMAETLYLSSVTIAELAFGIAVLPAGKRKQRLFQALEGVMDLFANRILSFDVKAAQEYGQLAIKSRQQGLGFPMQDGYIAAIAQAHHFIVATRDPTAFKAAHLTVINPWKA